MRKFWKGLVWALLVLAVALNVCILLGMRVPREHVVARSTVIHKPPVEIWQALTDYGSQPKWRPDVKSVDHLPNRNGLEVWRENYKVGGGQTLETEQWVPPTYLVRTIVDENGPVQGSWEFNIEPTGAAGASSKVTITERGHVPNPLYRFVSAYVYHYSYIDDFLKQLGQKFGEKVTVI